MTSPWQEVGDRTFRRKYEALRFNVGAIIGDEGVAIVDTRASAVQAQEILDDLKQLTDAPVRWVINTHYHWDHAWGNYVFRASPIWGNEACRDVMLAVTQADIDQAAVDFPDFAKEFEGLEIVPPDQTFTESATLDIGGREVVLHYFGLGHTNSDIGIHVPDANVLFGGDLVEEGAPPWYGDSYPLEWPATLQRMLALATGPVVPGHGDVIDRAYVENQLAEVTAVADLARQVKDGTTSADDAGTRGPYPLEVMQTAFSRL